MYFKHLRWTMQPWYIRICALGLAVIAGAVLARALALTQRIYAFRTRPKVSTSGICAGASDSELLARVALQNGLPCEPLGPNSHAGSDKQQHGIRIEEALRWIGLADSRFTHLCDRCQVHTTAIRQLACLTFLFSIVVALATVFPTWADEFNNSKVTGQQALVSALSITFQRITIGLVASVLFYAIATFFERALLLRSVNWRYFYAKAKTALDSKSAGSSPLP